MWLFLSCHNALWLFKNSHNTQFRAVAVSLMPQRVVVFFPAQWAFSIFERNIWCTGVRRLLSCTLHINIAPYWKERNTVLVAYATIHGLQVLLNFLGSAPSTSAGLFNWGTKVASYFFTKPSISRRTSGWLSARLFLSHGSVSRSKRQGLLLIMGSQGVGSVGIVHFKVDSALSCSISSSSGREVGNRLAIASPVRLCVTAVML